METVGKRKRVSKNKWSGVYCRELDAMFQGKPDIVYDITYKDADRKKIWEKVGKKSEGYTPQIAEDIRAERMRTLRHDGKVKTAREVQREKIKSNRTLDEIAVMYFESDHGKNLKGRVTDFNRYHKNLAPILGKNPISTITEIDLQRIKATMRHNSTATVYNALELLRRLVNYGVKVGACKPLNFTIKLPTRDNIVTEYLTGEQAARLMEVLRDWPTDDVPRMIKTAMLTGLRRGEIFKLQDKDLDFTLRLITLRNPKGGKDTTVPMSPPVAEILEKQILWRNKRFPKSSYVFPGRYGEQRVACNAAKRIKAKAKLPDDFRIFHGLRHHFAVTLANSGEFTLDMIGELLTHKDTKMTRRYSQFLPGAKQKASNRAAELIQNHVNSDVATETESRSA